MTPDVIESIVGTRARDSRRENRPDGNAPSRRRERCGAAQYVSEVGVFAHLQKTWKFSRARENTCACVHTLQSTNLQIALMIQLPEPDAKSSVIPLGLFRCGF